MIDMESLQANWPIVGGFLAGAIAWGKTLTNVASARASATKAHERIDKTEAAVSDIREAVARIETHYEHTMKAVETIQRELSRRR
jgi:hypothetical protein